MAVVRLKGLNKVSYTAKDGRKVVYYYAWKGGPKIETKAAPGTAEFMAAYNAAVASARGPKVEDTLAGLVSRYRASPLFKKLADSTRAEWARWLDRIADDREDAANDIGGLPLKALDDRRVRGDIIDWRDQWAATPRAADYAIQVLSRVLAFGVDRGELAINVAAGISQLYEGGRADQIWTEDELARYAMAAPSPEVGFVPHLAALTGLRRADLCKLSDAHVGDVAIVIPTGKSRGRKLQVIPLLEETKALLAEIRAQRDARLAERRELDRRKGRPETPSPTTVLTNTRAKPWTEDGLETQVIKTKAEAGIDKHLHDCRGTFATRLRIDGKLTAPEIADVMAWEEDRVQRLLETYIDRDATVRSIAERLNRKD